MPKLVNVKRLTAVSTTPQVFIIESLSLIDEAENRREGKVLADVLRMCGKQPIYYYIRTRAELEVMIEEFEASKYRYLHLSCHGGETALHTTIDEIPYVTVASILSAKLRQKRLFASACSAGNELFSSIVGSKNSGLISIAAPVGEVRFDHAVAFWSAFYVKMFSIDEKSMNSLQVAEILDSLSNLFSVPMHWSTKSRKTRKWTHTTIGA